jgi:Na+/H+ antiporter NhaC
MDFGDLIKKVYESLNLPERENISEETIKEKLSHIKNRLPTTFTSTISDER